MNLRLATQYYSSQEYKAKLQARFMKLKECENDLVRAKLVLEEFSVDPILFIETFCWTKVTKMNNEIKPFFLFDYQKKIIMKLWEAENDMNEHRIVIDKPREMGVTWTILAYFYWRWLFTPGWSGMLMSRSEGEVDDGTRLPDKSLFSKLRWMIDMTPQFMLPEGYTPKGKKGTSTDSELKLINPNIKSSITGSTTNTNAGRSSRFSVVFIDEAFFIENFMMVLNSLNTVSKTQIFASTSVPGSTIEKFVKAQAEKGDHLPLVVDDHPWKDKEWQEEKEKEAEWNPEAMRELKVSYSIPKDSQYYPQIAESTCESAPYDPRLPLYVSMDVGRMDLTVLVYWQYKNNRFYVVDCYANKNKPLDWYAPFISREVIYNPQAYLGYPSKVLEEVRKYAKPFYLFSGLDSKAKKMPLNKSFEEVLYPLIKMRITVNNYAEKHEARRTAVSLILPNTTFNSDNERVMQLYDAIANSQYTGAVKATSKTTAQAPIHGSDGKADYRSAFEYGAVNITRVLRHQRSELKGDPFNDKMTSLAKYLRA